jgi:hypothetical protein
MRSLAIAGVIVTLSSSQAYGQSASRFYAGVAAATQRVSADDVNSAGTFSIGTVVGVRLTPTFSVEFEANRGLGELSRLYSGRFVSFAGPDASREDIERLAVTMQSDTRWTPGFGWAVLGMWRSPSSRRVGVAVFAGITSTRYDERRTLTVLDIPAGVDVTEADLHQMLPDERVSCVRGGVTGGVLVPIWLTRQISVAPEIRYTNGSFIGDEIYNAFRLGARLTWGF